jgi:D-sedoheptulose 7-phosphate isomerase
MENVQTFSESYFQEARTIADTLDHNVVERMVHELADLRSRGGRLFFLGVGGNAANCSHAVNDFRKIAGIETYTPVDNAFELTARTNDDGWHTVFVEWLKGSNMNGKDAVFVFSVGGGDAEKNISPNIVHALQEAKKQGVKILGVVGRQGGYTKEVGDAVLVIPTVNDAHITAHTEGFQTVVLHCLVFHPKLKLAAATWERQISAKIKAIVFDLEGTIVDVEAAHHEGHRAAAKDVWLDLSLEDCFRYIPHFIGGPDEEIAKEIAALAKADWKHVLERMEFHYNRILTSGIVPIKPRDGFLGIYQQLKDRGIVLTIGALTAREQARVLLAHSGLDKLFSEDQIVFGEDVEKPQPSPDVFLETARRAGVNSSEQLVFDDSPRGIKAAVDAGSTAIGMPVYHRPEAIAPLLQAGAKRVFPNWKQIDISQLI